MRRFLTVLAVAMVAVLLLAVTGCDPGAGATSGPETAEEASGSDADGEQASDEGTGKGDDPEEGEGTELPDGWPADAPVYEGDIITSSKDADTFTVGLETADPAADVLGWYRDEFASGGWELVTDTKSDIGGTVIAKKGGVVMNATAGEMGDGTTILLTLMPLP